MPAEHIKTLKVRSDNVITWDGMTRETTGAAVNDATVTYALLSSAGAALSPAVTGTLAYVAASAGDYQGIIESSQVTLVSGTTYLLELTATSGAWNGLRRIKCTAVYHGVEN